MTRVTGPIDDLHVEEYESAPGFNQGYYLGMKQEAKQHWLYFAGGLVLGSIGSIVYWIDYLVGGIVK